MSCFVPMCSKYRTCNEKYHSFRGPKDPGLLRAWEDAIGRTDKKLTSRHCVCHKHFEDNDILKYHILIINGKRIEEPRFKWGLRDGAIPRLFLNLKETRYKQQTKISRVNSSVDVISEQLSVLENKTDITAQVEEEDSCIANEEFIQTPISKIISDKTSDLMVDSFVNTAVSKKNDTKDNELLDQPELTQNLLIPKIEPIDDSSSSAIFDAENSDVKEELMELEPLLAFDTLANNYKKVNIPKGWSVFVSEGNERNICISNFYKSTMGTWLPLKQLVLDKSMNMKFYVRDKIPPNIKEFVPMFENPIDIMRNFQDILRAFDQLLTCSGAAQSEQYPSISFMKTGFIKNDIWFSNQCKVILPQNSNLNDTRDHLCGNCRKFLMCLYKRKKRLKNNDPKTVARTKEEIIEVFKKSLEERDRLKLKNTQYLNKIESLKVELEILREELKVEMEDDL